MLTARTIAPGDGAAVLTLAMFVPRGCETPGQVSVLSKSSDHYLNADSPPRCEPPISSGDMAAPHWHSALAALDLVQAG
jgi:hypothetical protein